MSYSVAKNSRKKEVNFDRSSTLTFLLLGTFLLETEPQILKALSELMLCAPNNRQRPFSYNAKMVDFEYFRVLSVFS